MSYLYLLQTLAFILVVSNPVFSQDFEDMEMNRSLLSHPLTHSSESESEDFEEEVELQKSNKFLLSIGISSDDLDDLTPNVGKPIFELVQVSYGIGFWLIKKSVKAVELFPSTTKVFLEIVKSDLVESYDLLGSFLLGESWNGNWIDDDFYGLPKFLSLFSFR